MRNEPTKKEIDLDLMWQEFRVLWSELQQVGDSFLVAGGYGLYLKQTWLGQNSGVPTIVMLADWRNNSPRATRDFDVIVGLGIIADEESHLKVREILNRNGYSPTKLNPNWQFEKQLPDERNLLLDLHAQKPSPEDAGVIADRRRVKRAPSLKEAGIHARTNPEAVGCQFRHYTFEINGTGIIVPNPLTWCVMKLTAMRDQWSEAQNPTISEEKLATFGLTRDELLSEKRQYAEKQFAKHTEDVCRIVAMTTRGESDTIGEVKSHIQVTSEFAIAKEICTEFFATDASRATRVVANQWGSEDLETIRRLLLAWFA